ncbi:MAG: hypothetical protein WAL80_20265 [Xanthobacteraceae bacterium]
MTASTEDSEGILRFRLANQQARFGWVHELSEKWWQRAKKLEPDLYVTDFSLDPPTSILGLVDPKTQVRFELHCWDERSAPRSIDLIIDEFFNVTSDWLRKTDTEKAHIRQRLFVTYARRDGELDKRPVAEYIPTDESELHGKVDEIPVSTGGQTAGSVSKEPSTISPIEGLRGLNIFFRAFGAPNEKVEEESVIAAVALVAAKAIAGGRPKWDDRKKHQNLRSLIVPGFVREVYRDLIEGGLRLPDGRQIWHLRLTDGHPVWQEAVRSNDAKVVQILQGYINNTPDLGDTRDLVFMKKITRGKPKTPKSKPRQQRGRKPSAG